jgi:hypothetical protein
MGAEIANSAAAAGVIAIFVLTAVLLKLASMLYLRQKSLVVEIDASPKCSSSPEAEHAQDVEATELGTARPCSPPEKMLDGYSCESRGARRRRRTSLPCRFKSCSCAGRRNLQSWTSLTQRGRVAEAAEAPFPKGQGAEVRKGREAGDKLRRAMVTLG